MSKFKVGDVVRRVIAPNYGTVPKPWALEVGAVGVVWETEDRGNWLRLISKDAPEKECHDCEYFELVSRATEALCATYAPNVRPNDPATSHVAAVSIKPKKLSIKASILDLLEKHRGGLTGQEIAEYTGHRLNSITPRFAELSRSCVISNSGDVRNGQIVWVFMKPHIWYGIELKRWLCCRLGVRPWDTCGTGVTARASYNNWKENGPCL